MSKSLRGRLLAAIFCVGAAGAYAAPAGAETLADAIALAYDTNPNLQAQRAAQRALDEGYVQARAGFRPEYFAIAKRLSVTTRGPSRRSKAFCFKSQARFSDSNKLWTRDCNEKHELVVRRIALATKPLAHCT